MGTNTPKSSFGIASSEIEKLFTDPKHARTQLMADEQLHKIYRNILNTNIPLTEADALAQGYQQLSALKSYFHNPWYNPWKNSKYVGPYGHREAVYDRHGQLIRSDDYKGTFNFFPPSQGRNHKAADVDPYFKWGN